MIGIYMIENKVNGKRYVGQSWDIERRLAAHKANESNKHLNRAFQKYGLNNFSFLLLKEIHNTALTQILLDEYEKHYICIYNSNDPENGYNRTLGGSSKGIYSDEAKKDLGEKRKEEYRLGKRIPPMKGKVGSFTNRKHRQSSKNLISLANKGKVGFWKDKIRDAATNNKISSTLKGKKPWNKGIGSNVQCIETGVIYSNANSIDNIEPICIRKACRGKQITAGGFHWKYV